MAPKYYSKYLSEDIEFYSFNYNDYIYIYIFKFQKYICKQYIENCLNWTINKLEFCINQNLNQKSQFRKSLFVNLTDLPQVTDKLLSHKVVLSTPRHEQDSNSQLKWW